MSQCLVTLLDEKEWIDTLCGASKYSFFATPRYLNAWARHFSEDGHPRAIKVISSEGNWRLIAFIELTCSKRLRTRRIVAAPEGGYGVVGVGLMPSNWIELACKKLLTIKVEQIQITTSPNIPDATLETKRFEEHQEHAWIIDLREGLDTWVNSKLDKRARRQVKKSQNDGVVTQRHGIEGLNAFYSLYENAVQANPDRAIQYPKDFLRDLMCANGPGNASLYLTYFEEHVIAGGFLVRGGLDALAWIGAMDRNYASLNANVNRHLTVARDLVELGADSYNLGAAPGLPDIAEFKRKLGAEPRLYSTIVAEHPIWKRLRNLQSNFG